MSNGSWEGGAFMGGFRAGLFGGFIMQKLEGQGRAWIEVALGIYAMTGRRGEVTTYELPPGQTPPVHPGHVALRGLRRQRGVRTGVRPPR